MYQNEGAPAKVAREAKAAVSGAGVSLPSLPSFSAPSLPSLPAFKAPSLGAPSLNLGTIAIPGADTCLHASRHATPDARQTGRGAARSRTSLSVFRGMCDPWPERRPGPCSGDSGHRGRIRCAEQAGLWLWRLPDGLGREGAQ